MATTPLYYKEAKRQVTKDTFQKWQKNNERLSIGMKQVNRQDVFMCDSCQITCPGRFQSSLVFLPMAFKKVPHVHMYIHVLFHN